MQQAIGTELLNDHLLYQKKEPTHVVPSSHPLSLLPAPVAFGVPPLPSSARIVLAAARPTTFLHYRTLIRSAVRLPPESPTRSSNGGRPLTGRM